MSEDRPNSTSSEEQHQAVTGATPGSMRKPSTRSRKSNQPETTVAASETGASEGSSGEPSVDRAEKIVAEWTQRAGQMGAQIGQQFIRLFARAREEAEDIVAEAQALRRHEGAEQDEAER
jgi:hypothetical protein